MKELLLICIFLRKRAQYIMDKGSMLLDQTKLIQIVLKQYDLEDFKGITTPFND